MRDIIISFAEEHLGFYKIKDKPGGRSELIPDLCPFCKGGSSEDKGTFAISLDKGLFVCKRGSCGKRGRFEELAEFFHEQVDLKRPDGSAVKKKKSQYSLPDTPTFPPTEEIYLYFEQRKISRETVDAFLIRSDKDGNIVFPFYENGVCVFEKFRRPWKPKENEKKMKEWRTPGTKPILFGMDMCVFSKPLIITEGQIDAMSLYEAGVQNVVSVPSGCEDFTWVEHCYDWLEKFKTIILFGDNDDPGRKMVQTLIARLDESRCRIVEDYPQRPDGTFCKDANEVLYFFGGFELIEMVECAKEIPVKGLINLGAVIPVSLDSIPHINTMIPELDHALRGLREGSVTVWTGKAGNGKSTLSGLFALQAIEQGKRVCVYSGELSKEEFQEWINLQCAGSDYIGLKNDSIPGHQIPCISYQVQQRISAYYNEKLFLFDNEEFFEDETEANAILRVFSMAARRHGCKLFIVDNLMMALADSEEEFRDQKKFVSAMKKFARKFGAHVMIVAHPRKTQAGNKLGNEDVGGNSAIGNLADATIVMERPDIRIVKNRATGIQKLISCCYCADSRRIYQADCGDKNYFSWDRTGVPFPPVRADSLPEYGITIAQNEPF